MSLQPNSSVISYAVVASACAELIQQGDSPSVRKLRAHLGGGSFSTLQPHYHRWQDEQRLSQKTEMDLSPAFRQAVLAEIGRATEVLEKKMTEDLGLEQERLAEAQNLLLECESQMEKLKNASEAKHEAAEQNRLKLEREVIRATALSDDQAKREREYQGQIEALRQELRQAELKAAVSETQLAALQKQLNRFEGTQKPVEQKEKKR
ncbi:MAG TPA: DNA-binding protein [Gammaproteobacteria bacterium]|nr:DNA-binding protein [Gammaproteobacteria bacterium]